MKGPILVLHTKADRAKATHWIALAEPGSRVQFAGPVRTLDQNAAMWRYLTQIAEQLPWHGLRLTAADYKDLLSAGLKRELRTVPNITGDGFVVLGQRTSRMSKAEMSQMIELCLAFGAKAGVKFDEITADGPPSGGGVAKGGEPLDQPPQLGSTASLPEPTI